MYLLTVALDKSGCDKASANPFLVSWLEFVEPKLRN